MGKLQQLPIGSVKLQNSQFLQRFELNTTYLKSLTNDNLLRNFRLQAGLWSFSGSSSTSIDPIAEDHIPLTWHWGWEAPTCELRGHFLGHWLSGAALVVAQTKDCELRAKINYIVAELKKCQYANGGEWLAAIPESYMQRMVDGREVWAPHYTIHKIFMGLIDVYNLLGNETSLQMADRFANWFITWTENFTREEMDFILDYETGGMLEIWAELYGLTNDKKYLVLIERYDRPRLFDALLQGEDVLTNKHANTQIAEVLGAARAWEVTGEKRYREIVEIFWDAAVEKRGTYITGGVTCGEVWTPPQQFASRLGVAQEHCVVYHMMRLAQYLFTWTADVKYADFWERNLLNGVLAQQNKQTGLISYFLEMAPGSKKNWGSKTHHFWCCHGSLVQANAYYDQGILFNENEASTTINQLIPFETKMVMNEVNVSLQLSEDTQNGVGHFQTFHPKGYDQIQHVHIPQISASRPDQYVYTLKLDAESATDHEVKIRIPWWVKGEPIVLLNGEEIHYDQKNSYLILNRTWKKDTVTIIYKKEIMAVPLPDDNNLVAFMDGPLVLAGLIDEERRLIGEPNEILQRHNERHHSFWREGSFKTKNQERNFMFIPLLDVVDETYTIYFPIENKE